MARSIEIRLQIILMLRFLYAVCILFLCYIIVFFFTLIMQNYIIFVHNSQKMLKKLEKDCYPQLSEWIKFTVCFLLPNALPILILHYILFFFTLTKQNQRKDCLPNFFLFVFNWKKPYKINVSSALKFTNYH